MARPFSRASHETMERRRVMSARASAMLAQTPVPTSTCDWIISGLTCSPRSIRPCSRIWTMCDFSSRVCGSTIWNSSSMPRVNFSGVIAFSPGPNVTAPPRGPRRALIRSARQLPFEERAVFFHQPLKPDPDAAPRVAVDDLRVADDVAPRDRDAEREQRAFGDVGLGVHVEAAGADV